MIANRLDKIHNHRRNQLRVDHQLSHKATLTRRAKHRPKFHHLLLTHQLEGDMSAVPLPQPGQKVFLTIHWKDKPDSAEPRWRHWFFKYAYLPFQRFSFKLGIPPAKEVTITADKNGNTYTTFSWFENGSVYPNCDQADAACFDERDGYKPIYWGQTPPRNSAEIGGTVFPRAKNPRRWTKPTLALIITPRNEQEQIKAELKRLHEILDQ